MEFLRVRHFIGLFGGVATAWSLVALAQESATMETTKATTAVLPQIEVARVKPVDTMPPNLRLSDNLASTIHIGTGRNHFQDVKIAQRASRVQVLEHPAISLAEKRAGPRAHQESGAAPPLRASQPGCIGS